MKNSGLIFLVLTGLLMFCSCDKSQQKISDFNHLPTWLEVGVRALPDTLAEVNAPFETIDFQIPDFGDDTLRANLSGNGFQTSAIQDAIDEMSQNGGGIVVLPEGEWRTGRIHLKSNVNLHIPEGTVLAFSGEIDDYKPAVFTRIEGIEVMSLGACIYANGQENIAVTGKGKLIGPADGPVRDRIMTHDVIENVVDLDLPPEERVHVGDTEDWIFPPMFISPINCRRVYIEGVTLENTAFWNVVPIYCDNVIIRGITVNSVGIPRGDGIDVESSKNVLIEYSDLNCGDDCFTMKSGRGHDGLRVDKATENVVVRYCLAKEGHGGITCGSETAGMIRNLYVHDCVFENTGVGIRFKTRRPRGGGGENLYYERLRMNLRYTAIKWDMLGSPVHVGELANRLPFREVNELTPQFKNINISDIYIRKTTQLLKIFGIPESPVANLNISNLKAYCTGLISGHDVDGFSFRNAEIISLGHEMDFTDVRNVNFSNIDFQIKGNKEIEVDYSGELTDSIFFDNCSPGFKNYVKK